MYLTVQERQLRSIGICVGHLIVLRSTTSGTLFRGVLPVWNLWLSIRSAGNNFTVSATEPWIVDESFDSPLLLLLQGILAAAKTKRVAEIPEVNCCCRLADNGGAEGGKLTFWRNVRRGMKRPNRFTDRHFDQCMSVLLYFDVELIGRASDHPCSRSRRWPLSASSLLAPAAYRRCRRPLQVASVLSNRS